jgi:uncharacterized protein (TIGR03437 family)
MLIAWGAALAQVPAADAPVAQQPEWRKIGNLAMERMLASPASGPVAEVWFSADASGLYARTASGAVFATVDFENWIRLAQPPARNETVSAPDAARLPEPGAVVRAHPTDSRKLFALAEHLYRSDDGGRTWINLTGFNHESIIGPNQHDIAVSPADPEQVVLANDAGLWRSTDGGLSWTGLNQFLPNLPVERLVAPPANGRGMRIEVAGTGAFEWMPATGAGPSSAWQPVSGARMEAEAALRRTYSTALNAEITAVGGSGEIVYAGARDGRIWASLVGGQAWNLTRPAASGPVERLFVDAQSPRVALAALSGRGPHILRTTNTGGFWDDLTANLGEASAYGVTADRAAGVVYAATSRGVFFARADLEGAGPASTWAPVTGSLPAARATDVLLDAPGNQLYVALEGYGVYAAPAPHRARTLQVVNAADFTSRAAAPGSLVSVLGGPVRAARASGLEYPVLASSETGAQIQVPFEASGPAVSLTLDGATQVSLGLAVQPVSPAIFVDRDGAPLLLDADTGLMLDARNTARSGARIQILATGLGRVHPNWPTGRAAPLDNPPQVAAAVRAYVERSAVTVTRATLAPGYVGFYLIELQLPTLVNAGPAELYLAADGQESNRVTVYLEP